MNPLIQLKNTTPLILLALVCFGLLPIAKALLPPPAPDGGYPGGNTAEGDNALHDLTTGLNNTAVGASALENNTTGGWNVAIGGLALASNTTGQQNMAIGAEALRNNNANFNLAIGFRTLFMNTTGNHLTGVGAAALRNNTTAGFNTAIGADALRENTTGTENTAIGAEALVHNDSGERNNAVGASALFNNIDGSGNNAFGEVALFDNIRGTDNTAIGDAALSFNDITGAGLANNNTAVGSLALTLNSDGSDNTAVGAGALFSNHIGSQNTAVGDSALFQNNGGFNTAVGNLALANNMSGTENTALGHLAGNNVTTASNVICIGANVGGANVSNTCFIGHIRGVTTMNANALPVVIDSANQLGTMSSSRRFKKEIKPMDKASDAILALKPVTFHYKSDKTNTPQFGLIAEEVEKVNPALIAVDKEGRPYSVRYEQINAMLLNEFLKEHKAFVEQQRKLEQQGATIARQQKQIEALTAGLQKVSALVETSRPAPQVVNNP